MSLRCPDAVDPRPATLADHDWLINERGVATIEAFTGSQVHGVLWDVSERDLAALDTGPPRPGYLERIIDAALHHELPVRWIEFLRRWDPEQWPRPRGVSISDAPQSLSELLRVGGVAETSRLRSRFGFMAIHGGGLEQMTDVIAERAAEACGASTYVVRHPDHYPHHLPSAKYVARESQRLAEFL